MSDERQANFRFLVVDDQPFQRRLIAETLRNLGAVCIEQAVSSAHCFETLAYFTPDILVTDWDMDDADGVELVKRLRAGEAGPTLKKLPVIMVAERNRPTDIEAARNCGIDEYMLRPFNTASLAARIDAVLQRRREFVESVVYIGPCRRRKMLQDYEGPLRRLFDDDSEIADAPEVQIRKGVARTYVERIISLVAQYDTVDRRLMRDIFLNAGQLHTLAIDMKDRLLIAAAESLFNYVQGIGASPRLDAPVMQAHLSAMLQLLDLPNSQIDLRQTVTSELGVMVRKKLNVA